MSELPVLVIEQCQEVGQFDLEFGAEMQIEVGGQTRRVAQSIC